MRDGLRLSTITQVIESITGRTIVNVTVQIWRGDVHVGSVKIADSIDVTVPEQADTSTVEGFATVAGRIASRVTEQIQFERMMHKALHKLSDFEKVE